MKTKVLTLAAALAVVATTAGCGSGGTSKNANAISVGSFPGTIFTYPLDVAQHQGFFTKEGLKVNIVEAKSGAESLSTMLGGSTQIIYSQPAGIIPAEAQGQQLKVLGPYSRGRVVIVATEASGITSLDQLPGKKLAVPQKGDTNEQRVNTVLKEFGIDGSKVIYISAGTPASVAASLANGQADASVLGLTTYEALLNQGVKLRILADSGNGTMGERGKNELTGIFATTKQFWDDNQTAVGKFCRAMQSAIGWIADPANADQATTLLASWTGLPASAARTVWNSEHDTWSMSLDEKVWDANAGYVDPKFNPDYSNQVANGCS